MARKERVSKGKVMRPNYFVFCEGETEVAEMLERLQKVSGAELLCSNPCFELWLLLHYQGVKASLTSAECVKKLSLVAKQYKKGVLTDEMTKHLNANASTAIDRAETLQEYGNPSTTVYLLVKELERLKCAVAITCCHTNSATKSNPSC